MALAPHNYPGVPAAETCLMTFKRAASSLMLVSLMIHFVHHVGETASLNPSFGCSRPCNRK